MEFAHRVTALIARRLPVKSVALRAARPIASITFDDFPKSAWTAGGPLLARHGVRGTYYTAGGLAGRTLKGLDYYDAEDLIALRDAGHEIACHGFAHEPTPRLSSAALAADAERNAQFLMGVLNGAMPVSYAFPYGAVSPRTKLFYARRFSNVRGVHPGVNDGILDLAQLRTFGIEKHTWDEARIAAAIARAQKNRGWIVFHTHDVSDDPSPYGCTPAMLETVLKRLAGAGIEVLPMREAMRVATGDAA